MLGRLVGGLQTINNATRGSTCTMKVRQQLWKACKPLDILLMHWRFYKNLKNNCFPILLILFSFFLYFLLLTLLEWLIVRMVGLSLNDKPYLFIFLFAYFFYYYLRSLLLLMQCFLNTKKLILSLNHCSRNYGYLSTILTFKCKMGHDYI